jgi:hypothetical protein
LISISTKAIGWSEPFITSCSMPLGRRQDWPATRRTSLTAPSAVSIFITASVSITTK